MPLWITLLSCFETLALPLLGLAALVISKLTVGPAAQVAQQWFIGVLAAVTLITCRTVITSDTLWLLHTATLSVMVVGALLVPDRDALDRRRMSHPPRVGI